MFCVSLSRSHSHTVLLSLSLTLFHIYKITTAKIAKNEKEYILFHTYIGKRESIKNDSNRTILSSILYYSHRGV